MSHQTISATRDYVHAADKGDLTNDAQSAGFVSDPLLTPVTTSSMPHPMITPEPTLDPSTHHPNTHYDPEKKLSKKKRAKKFGVGSVHPPAHATNIGGRSFAETDKEHHERAERRDHQLAHEAEHDEEGDEEDEDDDDANEDELAASHNAHHENRITGTERQHESTAPAESKPRPGAGGMKHQDVAPAAEKAEGGAAAQKSQHEGAKEKDEGQKEEGDGQQTMMGKASGLLSSAQEKASAVLGSVTQQPMVSSLLNKVGLGGSSSKAENSTKDDNAQAKKEEEA